MYPALDNELKRIALATREMMGTLSDLELSLDVWLNQILILNPVPSVIKAIRTFDDLTFNLDGYRPTLLIPACSYISGYSKLGIDFIKPSKGYESGAFIDLGHGSMAELINSTFDDELENTLWILVTIVDDYHPLKGLKYVTSINDECITIPFCDPTFTATYTDEQLYPMTTGFFIDSTEILFKANNVELFEEKV